MNKSQKSELGLALKEKFSKANVVIFADYKGLSATQADELRKRVRAVKGEVKVLKNNIVRKILADAKPEVKNLADGVVGPTIVAFGYADAAATAKALHQFSKEVEVFQLKDSLMGEKCISVKEVGELASLPSREVMLAMLLGTMKAPVRDFVSVLAAMPRGLVTVLSAIEKKKAEGGQA